MRIRNGLLTFMNTNISKKLHELIAASRALNVTYLLSNILYLGKESRFNTPGTLNAINWTYRYLSHEIYNDNLKNTLFELNKKYNRLNKKNFI